MSGEEPNYRPSAYRGAAGSARIREFKIFAISQNKKYRPTEEAMNAFSKDEWTEFKEWADFRECCTYEDVVEWEFSDEEVKYYFPYEYFLHRADIIEEAGEMYIVFRDAIETPEEKAERIGFEGKWYCGICHGEPEDPENWTRIDCCDHGCDHMDH